MPDDIQSEPGTLTSHPRISGIHISTQRVNTDTPRTTVVLSFEFVRDILDKDGKTIAPPTYVGRATVTEEEAKLDPNYADVYKVLSDFGHNLRRNKLEKPSA